MDQETAARRTAAWRAANPERAQATTQAWRVANRERDSARKAQYRRDNADKLRNTDLLRMYGITIDEYDAMLAAQGGVCAICERTPTTRRLHVDHDHANLLVRGLLCDACNRRVVGRFHNGDVLRRAADYLDNPPAVAVLGERFTPKRKPKKRKPKTEGAA